jgi:hypothetical protein
MLIVTTRLNGGLFSAQHHVVGSWNRVSHTQTEITGPLNKQREIRHRFESLNLSKVDPALLICFEIENDFQPSETESDPAVSLSLTDV